MYGRSYVTYEPARYHTFHPSAYVVYEVEEPSPLCSAGQLILSGFGLIISSMAALCAVSTDAIVRGCEKSKKQKWSYVLWGMLADVGMCSLQMG